MSATADRSLSDATAAAVSHLGGTIDDGGAAELDVALAPMTTYRVGGNAAVFVRLDDRRLVPKIAAAARASGLPVLVVGRGSNMLVADGGFAGIAVGVVSGADEIEFEASTSIVQASAGVALPVLARKTAASGLTGFEWAVGVPGSIGGAVRMNAGGHGSDMAACLIDIEAADLTSGAISTMCAADLGLAFRSSALPATTLVLAARLQLAGGDPGSSKRIIDEVVGWRRANQPGGQNAGSVFVNPVPGEVTSGALIDAAGLRGLRLGTASVSEKHANFIQADEGGSADDVRELMRLVQERVASSSGYELRSEIRLVGFAEGDS